MNILLVRTGGLGDSVLTLPVANYIRHLYPGTHLHVLGNETMLSVARLSGMFDSFYSLETGDFYRIYSCEYPSDFLRSFFSQFRDVYFFTAADKEKITSTVITSGAHSCYVLNPHLPTNWHRHAVEYLITILGNSYGCLPAEDFCNIRNENSENGKRRGMVIHPGSGSLTKTWPFERFIRVAEESSLPVSFLLGPAEIERIGEKDLAGNRFTVFRSDSLDEVYHMLSGAEVYLGNDSGISHLASLCDTKSVVLFGPTDPVLWKPFGRKVTIVSSHDGTMDSIGVDQVFETLEATVSM